MFRTIRWRMLVVFFLLILSVMITVGTYLLINITRYYHDSFKRVMDDVVFTDEFLTRLTEAANMPGNIQNMQDMLVAYFGQMGINSFRNLYILDGRDAKPLYSTKDENADPEISNNILSALNGGRGNMSNMSLPYMDYAIPVSSDAGVSYIIYIKDTKDDLNSTITIIFVIIFWALFIGILMAIFMGLFLSRAITLPIASLKRRAERLASGDFTQALQVKSDDELGKLTITFNSMANALKDNLSQISQEKNKMVTVLQNMTDGIMAFDAAKGLIHVNSAATGMLGVRESDNIEFDSYFRSLGVNLRLSELLALRSGEIKECGINNNGLHIKASFAAFKSDDNEYSGVVAVLSDVTEQQRLDAMRREFVANVSHELRTPLTTIKSYVETLLDDCPDGGESLLKNFLCVINRETDRMTRIVKDLLTLSRLDYGKGEISMYEFDLAALISDVVKKLGIDARNHRHVLKYVETTPLDVFYGDRDRIEQVITNIIANAIKYTPDGGEIIVTSMMEDDIFSITILDTGMGIPEEDKSHIFERFYRVDKARSRESGGTGLGLSIAKEIVEMHGGIIQLESELNVGTRFYIKFPNVKKK